MVKMCRFLILLCFLVTEYLTASTICVAAARHCRIGYTPHPGFMEQARDGSVHGLGVEYFTEIINIPAGTSYIRPAADRWQPSSSRVLLIYLFPVMKTSDRAGKLYDYPLHAMALPLSSGLYVPERHAHLL